MRERLERLILEVSQLDISVHETVWNILRHPHPLNKQAFDDPLDPYIDKLNTVFERLNQLNKARLSVLKRGTVQKQLAGYRLERDKAAADIEALKSRINQKHETQNVLYEQIETLYLAAADDPLMPITKISDIDGQIERVKYLLCQFQQIHQEIQLKNWFSERAVLIEELKQFNVIAPSDDREGHQVLYEKIQHDLETISNHQCALESIHEKLADCISDKRMQDLIDTLPSLRERLKETTQSLDDFPLPAEKKQALIALFSQSLDRHQIKRQHEEEIAQLESQLNPFAWIRWTAYNQYYTERLQELKNELLFIERIEEQIIIESSIAATEESISKFEKANDKSTPMMTLSEIREQALMRIKRLQSYGLHTDSLDSLMKSSTNISAADLLIIVMQAMVFSAHLKDKKIKAKEYLAQITKLNGNIRELQIQFDIVDNSNNSSPGIQEKLLSAKTASQSYYPKLILTCQKYLALIDELNKMTGQSRSLLLSQRQLQKLIRREQRALDSQSVMAEPSSLVDNASSAIKELLELPPLKAVQVIEDSTKEIEENKTPSKLIENKQEMRNWQNKIQRRYEDMPLPVRAWYSKLCESIDRQCHTNQDYYKTSQLFRDIYFELKYPDKKQPCSVLFSYQSTFENPEQALNLILGLKPAFSPLRESFGQIQDASIAHALQMLYKKSEQLKHYYPAEARLLYQATRSIHHAALLVEKNQGNNFKAYSGVILDDPRYERLKRHRGLFFKLWEKIASCSRYLIGKIKKENHSPTSSYCSFFATKSTRLLLEAEKKLSHLRTLKFEQQMALTSGLGDQTC